MKKVLTISKRMFHPTVLSRRHLKRILVSAVGGPALEYVSDINKLDVLGDGGYRTVVLFFHEKNISAKLLSALTEFVQNGGHLFCIHGALASFKSSIEYKELTGVEFTGHDSIKDMHITGIVELRIRDELYEFNIADDCDIRLECEGMPVLWIRNVGEGTVACLSPGHRASTFKNPGFQTLIKQIIDELQGKTVCK